MSNPINPLVSVIIPTLNADRFLKACLQSLNNQTYKNFEIIIVDNYSTDNTKKIASEFSCRFYQKGPERSAQTNYGVSKAKGDYVYKIDCDFTLDKDVIQQCVDEIKKGFDAIVVHNSPDVNVSWIAKIRKFEVDMYKYDITHSSARFVKKGVYDAVGGFNSAITAGEDYDFQNKLNRAGYKTGFVDAEALHHGEPTNIYKHLRKYYDYGRDFNNYADHNSDESTKQLGFFRNIYFKNWKKFLKQPHLAFAFMIYNTFKFAFGGAGFIVGKLNKTQYDQRNK